MKRKFDYLAAATLTVPAAFLVWLSVNGLLKFASLSNKGSSIYFEFGRVTVHEIWALLLQLLLASVTLSCAVAIVRFKRLKFAAWLLGFSILMVVAFTTGIAVRMVSKERPNKAPEPTPTSVMPPANEREIE